MFHDLKCLSLDMTPSSEVMPKSEWLQRLNALGLSMHRMMAGGFFQTGIDNIPLRAYTIVGYIFLCLFLRELPLSSRIFDYLLECLSQALNEKNMRRDARWYPDRFLLWLLFVGGASAAGRTQRGWFGAQIPAVQARLNIKSCDEALSLLSIFTFVAACYTPFQELWEETESVLKTAEDVERQLEALQYSGRHIADHKIRTFFS
ncbi:uncharacterized protein N7483_007343 [Penicillium malachiteum]|uniref:uncharacterized protein n=1 Tax=Penicillium malachiteum TaxID=1324776 RepID=UPI0025468DC3|nr:uncharacterized protein N7483_007343 [Penicillium malachiteum]KAJ5725986.1 hypothetical protein N7483_007343 [Penicillium malachiteum]